MPHLVEVPDGCSAVFVSDQLIEKHGYDFKKVPANVEVRFAECDRPGVIDFQARYLVSRNDPEPRLTVTVTDPNGNVIYETWNTAQAKWESVVLLLEETQTDILGETIGASLWN